MFTACDRVKEENKAKIGVFSEKSSKVEHNSSSENFNINNLSSENKDYSENKTDDSPNRRVQVF